MALARQVQGENARDAMMKEGVARLATRIGRQADRRALLGQGLRHPHHRADIGFGGPDRAVVDEGEAHAGRRCGGMAVTPRPSIAAEPRLD